MWNSIQQPRIRLVTVSSQIHASVYIDVTAEWNYKSKFPTRTTLLLHGSLYFYLYHILNGSDPCSLIELPSETFWFWHIPMKSSRPVRRSTTQPFLITPSHYVHSGLPWHGLDHWLQVGSRLSWSQIVMTSLLSPKKHGSWKKVIHAN